MSSCRPSSFRQLLHRVFQLLHHSSLGFVLDGRPAARGECLILRFRLAVGLLARDAAYARQHVSLIEAQEIIQLRPPVAQEDLLPPRA